MTVIVRFPPSPTGKMHIGNARTALFNWLYARHVGGKFMLRIEDTDLERSTAENIAFIGEALEWLGIDWDNEPFRQTERLCAHVDAADKLVAAGKAYVDEEGVTRFKVPEGALEWDDLVQGPISIESKQVEDFALLRSDRTPTYHLGVVVDDAFMGVTDVIRGDDHINNTPKHILLFRALGYKVPQFGHLPLILDEEGHKLSKRHGAASIQDLRDLGYLPRTVVNYLARLGWGHGDREMFAREELVELFDIKDVHASPARYDPAKLTWLNAQYLQQAAMEDVLTHLDRFLPHENVLEDAVHLSRLHKLWPELTKRAGTLTELAEAAAPVLGARPDITAEDAPKLEAAKGVLALLKERLAAQAEWEQETLDATIHDVQKESGEPFKVLGQGLRLALIGKPHGPGLAALVYALGKDEVLARLG